MLSIFVCPRSNWTARRLPVLRRFLRRLGATQRVRAVGRAFHPGALDPAVRYARVLARRMGKAVGDSAWKDVGASICGARVQPVLQRGSGLFHDLELNRPAGLLLDNRRPVSHVAARGYVVDSKADEIAAAQLAVDGEVKHRQIACAALHLEPDTNGPDRRTPSD